MAETHILPIPTHSWCRSPPMCSGSFENNAIFALYTSYERVYYFIAHGEHVPALPI